MRFRLSTKPTWPALRPRVVEVLAAAFPGTRFDIARDEPRAAWCDGPAEGSVVAAVGDVPGWRFESALLGPDPDAPAGLAVLRLERSFSTRALAQAVVRFQGSSVRPYDPDRDGAPARLWAILEEDDPATTEYPLVRAMTDLLLDGYDGPADAAALSRRLQELGYDALWSKAWLTAAL